VAKNQAAESYDILVGIVVGAHGVDGEVRVAPETDFPERFESMSQVHLVTDQGAPRTVSMSGSRLHTGKGQVLLQVEGIRDREQAQALRGAKLYVRPSDLRSLPPGRFYEFQILGLRVVTEEGRDLGPIVNILRTGANDVYETPQAMIPATKDMIVEVDLEGRRMVVRWVEGLLK